MGERHHHPLKREAWIMAGAGISLLLIFIFLFRSYSTVTIVLGGDIMLARSGKPILSNMADFGDSLPLLQKADLAMANLESPLTAKAGETGSAEGYNLCSPASSAILLRDAGFDLFSIANNHDEDCSVGGETETADVLQNLGISAAGNQVQPIILSVRGQKIAVLAYDDINKPLDMDRVRTDVSSARREAKFVIVSLHWGNEYQAGPDEMQVQAAQDLADAGVDVIWGHHPHVLQRIDWLQSASGKHRTLVIYSLGNLISDQNMIDDVRQSALVRITLRAGKNVNVEAIPLVREFNTRSLMLAAGTDRTEILERLQWTRVRR